MVQCQLQALQDNKQNASHSDLTEKTSPCSDISALVAAQQLLELSVSTAAGKVEPKQEVRLNGLVRPLPQPFNKDKLVSVNGGGCDGDISGGIGEGSDGGKSDGDERCADSSIIPEVLYSVKENALENVASECCNEVPPDPPDRNGCSPDLSSPADHTEHMEEEREEAEMRQEEAEEEPMDLQTETQPHPWENLFGKLSGVDPPGLLIATESL